MAPDETDDAQSQGEGGINSQFYNMSAFPYRNQFLGLVTHFRLHTVFESTKRHQSSHDGPIDVQLTHSRDGRTWHRCEDRSPVIPNGPYAYDAGSILGVSNAPVIVDDELWMYYTAITTGHGGTVPEKRITIALAKWRLDGFVSLDAGDTVGVVQTVPKKYVGDALTVNANVSGALTVAVLDDQGSPLPGFAHGDCAPLTGDSVRHRVSWAGQNKLPNAGPIRLEFRMKNAELYSFTMEDSSK
jgi:hypothetical protein